MTTLAEQTCKLGGQNCRNTGTGQGSKGEGAESVGERATGAEDRWLRTVVGGISCPSGNNFAISTYMCQINM